MKTRERIVLILLGSILALGGAGGCGPAAPAATTVTAVGVSGTETAGPGTPSVATPGTETPAESPSPATLEPTSTAAPTATQVAATSALSPCSLPYFPVAQGAQWQYRETDPGVSTTQTDTWGIGLVRGGFVRGMPSPSGRVPPASSPFSSRWTCSAGGLTDTRLPVWLTLFGLQGTSRAGVTLPAAGKWHAGASWAEVYAVSGKVQADSKVLEQYSGTIRVASKMAGPEKVTVPAGTFDAMRVDSTFLANYTKVSLPAAGKTEPPMRFVAMRRTSWYAPNVGRVKDVVTILSQQLTPQPGQQGLTGSGNAQASPTVFELTAYHLGGTAGGSGPNAAPPPANTVPPGAPQPETSTTVPATSPDPAVVAHDEAVVSATLGNCAAFRGPNGSCPFGPVVPTSDGSGNLLYGFSSQTTGDDCFRGIAYFFDGERLLGNTSQLPPNSIGGVVAMHAAGPRRFAVGYGVSPSKLTSCAENGSAGTDTYVYGWNGSRMFLVSGTPPAPPKVIVGSAADR